MEEKQRLRSVRYRLYPNATQTRKLERALEICRMLYNLLLDECVADLMEGRPRATAIGLTYKVSEQVRGNPSMRDAHSTCLREVCDRVVRAMKGCRLGSDGELVHEPRYKTGYRYHSFTYKGGTGFRFEGDRLYLSKIGLIRYRNDHHPKGDMVTCTVKRDGLGRWYAVIVYRSEMVMRNEENIEEPRTPEAYDLGLHDIATDTQGNKFENPNLYAENEEKIAGIQRRMSKHERGTPQWEKCRRELAKVHERIHRQMRAYLQRMSKEMVRGHSAIVFEALEPQKMKEKAPRSMRKKYTDASWGELMRTVRCEAAEAGIPVTEVNPRNTSKMCSQCGNIKNDLTLADRTYRCSRCGFVMDRDQNAAINILRKGLGVETCRFDTANGQPS